jgi:hypothetical protein
MTRGILRRLASERLEVPRAFTKVLVPKIGWSFFGTSIVAE